MSNRSFDTLLRQRWSQANSLLCVGLDPDPTRIPEVFAQKKLFSYCQQVVDVTAPYVCAFKPQIAYFSAYGLESVLVELIAYIHEKYPAIPVILDAKRGDIGSTATMYAREAFERYQADAVTVNPWLGYDSVEPYLSYADKGVIVLCRTSNPSSMEIQDLPVGNQPLYLRLAEMVSQQWNKQGNCYLVVGATYPSELNAVRQLVGNMPILVPGIGAQGGDVAAVLAAGKTPDGCGLIINSARAILYPSNVQAPLPDMAAIQDAAEKTRDLVNRYR